MLTLAPDRTTVGSADESANPPMSARALGRRLLILMAYGIGFTLLRSAAHAWATHQVFSVWFPAAGLRFAFLWIAGPRWTPWAALAELVVSVGSGSVALSEDLALSLGGIVGPCLVYGVVIHIVRSRMGADTARAAFDPLPFAAAAVVGPIVACVAALPWALPLASARGSVDAPLLFSALLVFTLGDLLGILILAPPLLWIAGRARSRNWRTPFLRRLAVRLPEFGACIIGSWALVWLLQQLGDGLVLAPVLLAACWCGLRGGRVVAWAAILISTAIVLPLTGDGVSDAMRVQVHMQLACVAVGAYLAGSYADAQAMALREIGRRDRLLLHAERLKSLRAMSVAVIHEVSQPLSTIAIEARALVKASESDEPAGSPEVSEIAAIIARKADHMAELMRRLRAFGSGTTETRSVQTVAQLMADVLALAAPEAAEVGVAIESAPGPNLSIDVHDVEIRQAMLNLVRNAIAAAPDASPIVNVAWSCSQGFAEFSVENRVDPRAPRRRGMGLGLIISRTIAQAHGGRLDVDTTSTGTVRSVLQVPLADGSTNDSQ